MEAPLGRRPYQERFTSASPDSAPKSLLAGHRLQGTTSAPLQPQHCDCFSKCPWNTRGRQTLASLILFQEWNNHRVYIRWEWDTDTWQTSCLLAP